MAISLPKYQQQVSPSAEAQTVAQGGDAGSSSDALASFAGTAGSVVGALGQQYVDNLNDAKDNSDLAKLDSMITLRSDEAQRTMSTMDDPEEINKFYEEWERGVRKEYENANLSNRARQKAEPNLQRVLTANQIKRNGIITKATIESADRQWIDMQVDALDGKIRINPETGADMTPEEANAYAVDQRISLGTMDYEKGQDEKRSFGKNLQYKEIVTIADNDVDEANRRLKESNLDGEQLILATDAVRDARDRQNKMIKTTQATSADEINREVQNKRLSRQQLNEYGKKTVDIMGKEVPVVSESVISANRAALDASEDFDALKFKGSIENVNELIKNLASEGSLDFGQKETDKVYKGIAMLGAKGASKASIESLLNLASLASTDYASGRGWNNASVSVIGDITDSLTTLYTEHPTKYKGVDPIGSIATKLDSFIKVVEEHKGQPSEKVIKEWREDNMKDIDRDTAIMNYSNVYRVGERERVGNQLRIYKGDGTFVVEGE